MSRSIWKSFITVNENLDNFKKIIKVTERNAVISLNFLNRKVKIYNGKSFINIFIYKKKFGYKFGEFVYTIKLCIFKKFKKSKKLKK